MRLAMFCYEGKVAYGFQEGKDFKALAWEPYDGSVTGPETVPMEEAEPLAPVAPTKIVAVGLNYRDHAEEMGLDIPEEPILFLKPPSSVVGHLGTVIIPEQSKQVEYEGELAVVMGKEACRVARAEADEYVLGYTCGLDMTARDLQYKDGQWTRAKSFDTFCPLGPWVETDLDSGDDLSVELKVNGEVKQSSRTSNLIFGVPELVEYISSVMTMYPGDVIMTGTPSGVGPVVAGDVIDLEIEGVGRLSCGVEECAT